MRTLGIWTVAVIAAAGFSFSASAGGPSADKQTSAQQVKTCQTQLNICQGGDFDGCYMALKNCVGKDRKRAMDIVAGT